LPLWIPALKVHVKDHNITSFLLSSPGILLGFAKVMTVEFVSGYLCKGIQIVLCSSTISRVPLIIYYAFSKDGIKNKMCQKIDIIFLENKIIKCASSVSYPSLS
jgi:hypothetical protein